MLFGWISLACLSYQPKALHVVSPPRWDHVYIIERGVALSIVEDCVFPKRVKYLPAPFPVDGIVCDSPHHEKAFHGLWALQTVRVQRLDNVIFLPGGFGVFAGRRWQSSGCGLEGGIVSMEPGDLGRKPGFCNLIHSPACLHELSRKLHLLVLFGAPARRPSCFGLSKTAGCT